MGDSYREELKKSRKKQKAYAATTRRGGSRAEANARSKAIAWQQSRAEIRDKAKQARMRFNAV